MIKAALNLSILILLHRFCKRKMLFSPAKGRFKFVHFILLSLIFLRRPEKRLSLEDWLWLSSTPYASRQPSLLTVNLMLLMYHHFNATYVLVLLLLCRWYFSALCIQYLDRCIYLTRTSNILCITSVLWFDCAHVSTVSFHQNVCLLSSVLYPLAVLSAHATVVRELSPQFWK